MLPSLHRWRGERGQRAHARHLGHGAVSTKKEASKKMLLWGKKTITLSKEGNPGEDGRRGKGGKGCAILENSAEREEERLLWANIGKFWTKQTVRR